MVKFDKVYSLYREDYSEVDTLCKELNISPLMAKVLINRGFCKVQEARNFLNTDLDSLIDPFLLKDMEQAVARIIKAIESDEKICIYGDYDADGVTSTSVLLLFLEKIGANCIYYLPNRLEEGYGLNKNAVDKISDLGVSLVITVDCGITNIEEVGYLNKKGIDVIVTDHHQCGEVLPNCVAVINPNREDCSYPFKKLAGVGVAFKLVQGLSEKLGISIDYEQILPIVAVGTVADVMPLVGENRVIVKNGLKIVNNRQRLNIGLEALLEVSGLKNKEISSYHIGFVLGPRLNAAGRLGVASTGVKMFVSKNYEKAFTLAKELDEENKKRQEIEDGILKEAEELIKQQVDLEKDKVIVLASDKWHSGIIGICASKLTDKYFKPTILFAIEGDLARGSARSIPTLDIYDSLTKCGGLFEKFGGHKQAAGISIKTQNIEAFRKKINNIVIDSLDEEDFIPKISIDCEIGPEDINLETIMELKELEPFGIENPYPQFIYREALIDNIRSVGRDNKHLKLVLEKDNNKVDAIAFNFGKYENILEVGDSINVITTLEINEYMGMVNPQFKIRDIADIELYQSNLDKDYYYHIKKCLKLKNKQNYPDPSNLNFYPKDDRVEIIIDKLKNEDSILVLVFNYYNLQEILKAIKMEGRDIIKRTSITYNLSDKTKPNGLVILPILSEIDFKDYEKVILYDLNLNKDGLLDFMNNSKDLNIEFLFTKKDIEKNKKLMNIFSPTAEEMKVVCKTFTAMKGKGFKVEPDTYLSSINRKTNQNITRFKLDLIFEILKDMDFIDFINKDGFYFIKVLTAFNEKIDIIERAKVKYLYSLNNFS